MKQKWNSGLIPGCGLIVLVLAGLAVWPGPGNKIATLDAGYWTCAMHPSVHSRTPGKCPICGMDLVPVPMAKAVSGANSSHPSEFVVPKGFGKLEPRFIEVGHQFVDPSNPNQERYYQVIGGLQEGERIVSSANFLIDAEAQVQGAVRDFR